MSGPTIGDDNLEFLADPKQHKETLRLYRLESHRADHAEVRAADLERELERVKAQRDRAMELHQQYDGARTNTEAFTKWMRDLLTLKSEIAKEKEAK
jgi:hypothetical protein